MDVRRLRVREEVEDLRYEPATDLGEVVKGRAPPFVQDGLAFFERTFLTESMKALIVKALMNLLGLKVAQVGGRRYEVSSNLILLPSDLGGGKTHAMILLYHVFRLIGEAESREEAVRGLGLLDGDLAEFVSQHWGEIRGLSPKVVVIDCKYRDLAPGPVEPIRIAGKEIKTLWGYLGYELGRYEVVRNADERETAPYADVVHEMLNDSRALVLIDEIGRYYDQSGLDATKISAFLMNLAEAMSKFTVNAVSVVVSIPYEVVGGRAEAKAGMEYVHTPELVRAINEVLSRPNVEIVKPVGRQDIAEILRKRIFAHSREELERFAGEFLRAELAKEYPEQVRRVLDERGFWGEIRRSYPFHPGFVAVLERLAYKLPYLQRTRDAIKIAVQTVLALKEGVFDWVEEETGLVMPYHIPVLVSEVLDASVLRNAPREYKVFQLILRSNVVEPHTFASLKGMGRDEFFEKVVALPLRGLKEEDAELGFKLGVVIWLYSLVGLGLPMNMGEFPTTVDLVYMVSPTGLDVRGVLGILRSVMPQLIIHGEPDSDTARWFFTSIPSVEELIRILKKNVTDSMAKDKLAELLEWGLTGKKPRGRPAKHYGERSIFDGNVAVVKSIRSVSTELLDSRDPGLIILADVASGGELGGVLRGRNQLVVLAPHVKGVDGEEKLSPEDIKGIRELASMAGRSVWEGLLEILRYYVATESITEANLRSFIGEKIVSENEEYENLSKDLMNLLKSKVEGKKQYFYRSAWGLLNRVYRRVYYHRMGAIRVLEGLVLESDKPIAPIVEEFLREKNLIPPRFTGENILSMFRDYLGKDPEKDPINVGHVWRFIRTTDRADVPIISWAMYVDAVKDLIRSLDYAVKLGGTLLWKPVFASEGEARGKDEGKEFLNLVVNYMSKLQFSWEDLELVYWENVFDEWVKRLLENLPEDKQLMVIDVDGNIENISDVLEGFDPYSTVRAGKLFYKKKEYLVEFSYRIPEEVWEGRGYEGLLNVNVKGFEGEITVKLSPDRGLEVDPTEYTGRPPLSFVFRFSAMRAGDYRIGVEVFGGGKLLERRFMSIPVKGEWKEKEVVVDSSRAGGWKKGGEVRVVAARADDVYGVQELIRLARRFEGSMEGRIVLGSGEDYVAFDLRTEDRRVLEMLWNPINALSRLLGGGVKRVDVLFKFRSEPVLEDVVEVLTRPNALKFRVRERAD